MRGLGRRQPAREGSACGTGNGGGYFIHHQNGALHRGVGWPSLCPYLCLKQHAGVQILFFWFSLAEVGRPHQKRWEVGSLLTKAALPGLAASSPPAWAARVTPELPELLQRAEQSPTWHSPAPAAGPVKGLC